MTYDGTDSCKRTAGGTVARSPLVETGDMIRVMMQLGYDYVRQDQLHLHFGVNAAEMKAFLAEHERVEIAFKKGQMLHKLLDRHRAMTSGNTRVLIMLGCSMLGQERPAKTRRRNRQHRSGNTGGSWGAEKHSAGPPTDTGLVRQPKLDPADDISCVQKSEPEFRSAPVPLSRLIRPMK